MCYNSGNMSNVDFIEKILKDKEVLEAFAKIDGENKYVSSHGIKHVYGCLIIAQKLGSLFKLSERDQLLLEVSLVLHDIGQCGGRQNHANKSVEFAKNYLPKQNELNETELKIVYDAIETHDDYGDYGRIKTKIAWLVNLIDKLDFSKTRVDDGYRERFDYSDSEDIERLDFYLIDNVFKIVIKKIEKPLIISVDGILNRNLTCKSLSVFKAYCEQFDLKPLMASMAAENEKAKKLNQTQQTISRQRTSSDQTMESENENITKNM